MCYKCFVPLLYLYLYQTGNFGTVLIHPPPSTHPNGSKRSSILNHTIITPYLFQYPNYTHPYLLNVIFKSTRSTTRLFSVPIQIYIFPTYVREKFVQHHYSVLSTLFFVPLHYQFIFSHRSHA